MQEPPAQAETIVPSRAFAVPPLHTDFGEPWNFLEIDLDRLVTNWELLRARIPAHRVIYAVVKSDAYGHGLEPTSRTLADAGCRHFAVESPQEGMRLRRQGIDGEILLLNPIPEWMAEMAVYYDLSVSVIHPSILPALQTVAQMLGKRCRVHLNVNVGLHRLGIAPSKLLAVARDAVGRAELELEGLMAQPRDHVSAPEGFEKLIRLHAMLGEHGIHPRRMHFANSTSFLAHPRTTSGGARLGILLYGVLPPEQFGVARESRLDVWPVMSLTSRIVQIRSLEKGAAIGYRARSRTTRDSEIGTIPIGYSHGLDRKLHSDGHVLVRGARVPFIGTPSMNSSTLDLTDLGDARIGEPVTILGRQGDEEILINDLAAKSGTISAELMVRFGQGIGRRYRTGGGARVPSELSPGKPDAPSVEILVLDTESELPEGIHLHALVRFLQAHLGAEDDPADVIRRALDYSLSAVSDSGGFLVLAYTGERVIGLLACARTTTGGFIPENIVTYLCIHREHRRRGIGRALMERALETAEGDFKLHVRDRGAPAVEFCARLGFHEERIELRNYRGGAGKTWRT